MKKSELETALRAATRVCGQRDFIIIGSQAVHAYCRRPPAEVLLSQECDIYPRGRAEAADLLHVELGRGSKFAREHGFYLDVVTPDIASLPPGWQRRLKRLRIGKANADCLEIHDLLISKLAAGRLKDLELAGALLKRSLADPGTVRRRIGRLRPAAIRSGLRARLAMVQRGLG